MQEETIAFTSMAPDACELTSGSGLTLTFPEYSDWQCYLFGAVEGWGMVYRPRKGEEPNWFWRKMQFLAFGNRWVKVKK